METLKAMQTMQALRRLKALARGIVEELEAEGRSVAPAEVATRVLLGLDGKLVAPTNAHQVRRQIEDHVRDLRAHPEARF
jgi:hypothetical protein